MADFSGWKTYKDIDRITTVGIQSPDGRESKLLIAIDVAAWLAVVGNATKLI